MVKSSIESFVIPSLSRARGLTFLGEKYMKNKFCTFFNMNSGESVQKPRRVPQNVARISIFSPTRVFVYVHIFPHCFPRGKIEFQLMVANPHFRPFSSLKVPPTHMIK